MNTHLDDEIRRKRLRFRCWHRGMREVDLLLGRFVDAHLATLSEAELDALESLLNYSDTDLYDWITGATPWPKPLENELTRALNRFGAQMSRHGVSRGVSRH